MKRMKHGTILRNMYQPSFQSYLIYRGVEGEYAKCIWIINTGEKEVIHYNARFFKRDVLNDRENFPIVGYIRHRSDDYKLRESGSGKQYV